MTKKVTNNDHLYLNIMKKSLLMKSMLLLCALMIGTVGVGAQTTIWSENFDGLAADAKPTTPTNASYTGVTYVCTNGKGSSSGTTKVMDEKLAGGASAPELMVGKKGSGSGAAGGTFKAVIPLDNYEGTLTLTYYQNKYSLKVSSTTNGVSGGQTLKPSSVGQQTTTFTGITSDMTSITIVFEATTSNNVRLDDIVLTGMKATGKEPAGLAYTTAKYATTFGVPFATPSLTNPNSLAVTYATSDAAVADVNTTTGAVTIKNKIGSATITASTEGDATHNEGTASYTIYVFEHDGSASNNAYTVSEARTFIMNELYDADASYYISGIVASVGTYYDGDKTLTYYLSDNGVNSNTVTVYKGKGLSGADFAAKADMQALDQVTLHGKFTIYNSTTPQITNSEQVYFKRKLAPELEAIADFDMYRDTEKSAESLFTIASDGEVSYESSDETVVKIVDGKLKALKVGTATITISVPATDDYNAGSDNVTVTVKNRDAVAPEGAGVGGFTKITSTSELTDGDYLIVCESQKVAFNGGLETLDATSNYINVTISDNTIASSDETNNAIFTYDATAKTLLSKSGKYIGRTANSNGLDASTTSLTNNISFVGTDEAVIASPKGPALQFNKTSGQTRFRYFTGTQTAVQLYKKMAATSYDITIGSTGYKTLISAVSATLPVGVTAYKAISAGEGKVKLTSVASIKAGSAYVLKGTPSTNYTLTVTDTPEEPTGNILEISDENTSNGVYVLANGSSGAGFYKWMGGSLGAGRVIVPASAVSGAAREYMEFSFDDDATAIEAVKAQNIENSEFFDLQGRCVAQPTKGLYIVNGKKVLLP